jgi:segregation and condensation protein B
LYKTTKEFLMRFGLKDVNELPSMEEFEKLVAESFQAELIPAESEATESAVAPANENQGRERESVDQSVPEAEKAG